MEKNLTAQSFIVRVYRADTEDWQKIAGLVEALGGSGKQERFRNADELAMLLSKNACAAAPDMPKDAKKAGTRESLENNVSLQAEGKRVVNAKGKKG